jgi:membrane associated rhomboid family serine protease
VIPIRDINHTRRTPIVTWAFIGANILIFVGSLSLGKAEAEATVMRFGVIPDVIVHGDWAVLRASGGAIGSWVTPFTSMFLHGGLLHLGSNMLFLHVFGDNVEDVLGRGRFFLFYTLCGALFPHARVVTLIPIFIFIHFMEVPAWIFIVLWFVLQLVQGYLALGIIAEGGGGVAWFAHIGGFLAGLVCIRVLYRKPKGRRRRLFR